MAATKFKATITMEVKDVGNIPADTSALTGSIKKAIENISPDNITTYVEVLKIDRSRVIPEPYESIYLNNQTVGNLKKYLARFPNTARVIISGIGEDYRNRDCLIAYNFDYQEKNNIVQFILGMPVKL